MEAVRAVMENIEDRLRDVTGTSSVVCWGGRTRPTLEEHNLA